MTDLKLISVTRQTSLRDALKRLDVSAVGILFLVDSDGILERTVSDGDIRRLLIAGVSLDDHLIVLPSIQSIFLTEGYTRQSALELMNTHNINHLPVVDSCGCAIRLVTRKDVDERILLSTPHLGHLEREYVEDAFRTNWIAPLGPNVDGFESELSQLVGVPYAAALSSGTAAIHLGLILLGVERGDTVFCSALTFAASANPILYQGANPVFIDSEPNSWNLSPSALEDAFQYARSHGCMPKAVIVVNLYGQCADYDPILDICRRHSVPIIEDAAESLGASYKGRPSGSLGDIGIFSFNGNKIITTSGGGMLVSEDEALVSRARFLSTQAREPVLHYEHKEIGYNYRMSNILAGVGRGQLSVLDDRVNKRRKVFDYYSQGFSDNNFIEMMPEPEWSFSNRWLSACTINQFESSLTVEQVINALAVERIEARPLWKPMQLQPVFSSFQYFPHEGSSVSQRLFETGFCLPSGSNMSMTQQDYVIDVINSLKPG